jgi:putative membrane protein
MNKKALLTIGLIALGLILLVTAVTQYGQANWAMGHGGMMSGMMGGTGMMGFGGLFGFLLMLLFWGGIIALAVWLVSLLFPGATGQSTSTPDGNGREGETALEILKKRYAHGELSRHEYQQMRQDLEHGFSEFADKAS